MVLANQAERQLVRHGFAAALRAGRQKLLDANRVRRGGRVRVSPTWVSTAGQTLGDVNNVFDAERQSIERPGSRRLKNKPLDERPRLFGRNH
jgi:hypothetical protein